MRLWVIAYDIADDRRRRRVARLLATRVERVQESIFEGWLHAADIRALIGELGGLIEPAADAVRAYPVTCREPGRRKGLGGHAGPRPPTGYWLV
jgi:CRISPR-associated protein Cas2